MLNWIVWNGTVFTFKLCVSKKLYSTELFEILSKWFSVALNDPKRVHTL